MSDISNAVNISGWMSVKELAWLAMQAENHTRILEIGSHLGRSTRALADNTSGHVMAVDDWKGPRDTSIPWKDRQGLYEKFCQNMSGLMETGKVFPIRANHDDEADIARQVLRNKDLNRVGCFDEPKKPDMIFIDGDHQRLSVMRDIAFCKELLAPGGLICGHDYALAYPGVLIATAELIGPVNVVPETSIWWSEL